MTKLTIKQERFCQFYIETGNASEAYRRAYEAEGMKPASINRSAAELLQNPKITARLGTYQSEHAKRHDISVDSLIRELEDARQIARGREQGAAMVQATMGKARLMGFDKGEGDDQEAPPTRVEVTVVDARVRADA